MMRLLLIAALVLRAAPAADYLPVPVSVAPAQGSLIIDQSFSVAITGYQDPRTSAAASRMLDRLSAKTGMPLPSAGRGSSPAALRIECAGPGEQDESYRLEIAPGGARLSAPQPLGILRGLETFLQAVEPAPRGFSAAAVTIEDRPRFVWRGLLIDSARHFLPLEVIKRNLDGMAAVKMNVLHWHLTDDQGFRVEVKSLPRLHQAASDGLYYTQEQIREIIAYARDRGIRVIPEFEMPGHATAILTAFPELASAPGPYTLERRWGIFDPTIDPTREEVYQFLDTFLGEMSGLFPEPYIHIGGDEVNGKQWNASPRIQAFMKQRGWTDNHALQAYFNQRVQGILKKHGKRMMGWDEIFHPSLPKDILIHSWRGQKSLAASARQGYQGILSFGYYLDHMQTAAFHYQVDPMAGDAAALTPEEQARILGGEACMWAEYVTPETIDSRIWPRAAAVAERLWSPAHVKDAASLYRRLDGVARDLEWLGLRHRSGLRPMLQRLAGSSDVDALEVLVRAVEPVKLYGRSSSGDYTSFTPLNRLVDAARPESDAARELPRDRRQARERLARWSGNHARLTPAIDRSFLLAEVRPLSEDFSAVAQAGVEAIDFLANRRRPPQAWLDAQLALLDRAARPRAEVTLAIVAPVRTLVEEAGRIRERVRRAP